MIPVYGPPHEGARPSPALLPAGERLEREALEEEGAAGAGRPAASRLRAQQIAKSAQCLLGPHPPQREPIQTESNCAMILRTGSGSVVTMPFSGSAPPTGTSEGSS